MNSSNSFLSKNRSLTNTHEWHITGIRESFYDIWKYYTTIKMIVDVVWLFLDYSKAFDVINHNILLQRT